MNSRAFGTSGLLVKNLSRDDSVTLTTFDGRLARTNFTLLSECQHAITDTTRERMTDIPSDVRGPSKSIGLPSTKNLMVGNPRIPYCPPIGLFDSAYRKGIIMKASGSHHSGKCQPSSKSIAATLTFPESFEAAASYSGFKLLQCPHHGA